MLEGKNIIIGVTGGIAAYKVCDLVSRLKKLNANVEIIMTKYATEFISPLTFQTMSNNPVHVEMFERIAKFDVEHISLAQKADLLLVAPASANTIGKIANGLADNLLTTVIMASKSKVVFAPAMNTSMYTNPIVQENINKLKTYGYDFIEPGSGRLACGDYGAGKMAEPEDMVDYIISSFKKKDLEGRKVLITAGPTQESIDPVRYLTNHSTGKMGYSIAKEARDRGAEVTIITGPTSIARPKGVKVIDVNTTLEMFEKVGDYFDGCDVLIKSAAPADYRPEFKSENKIKKTKTNDKMEITLIKNPDIAKYYGSQKNNQVIVGFAAETDNLIEYAKNKLESKNFDFIVANDVTEKGAGFKSDTNIVTIIDKKYNKRTYPIMNKSEVANIILDKVVNILKDKS